MSGIYGYVMNPDCKKKMPDVKRLGLWNAAYGKEKNAEETFQNAVLGCYVEKLKTNAAKGDAVWKRGEKTWVIDAVLYNREELLAKLERESSDFSDEEIIISLIEKEGFDVLSVVNGDFAGAVYDVSDNSVTLFRDHMGIRPLYYYVSEDEMCFSTDIRGVLSVESVDAGISKVWLYNCYFDFIDYSDVSTEYAKIFCVRPASVLKVSFGGNRHKNASKKEYKHRRNLSNIWDEYREGFENADLDEKKYWQLGAKKIRYKTEDEYINRMRELVEDSLKRRLNAFDGIAGAEFSGGLDSSLISILIHRMGRECKYISWSLDPSVNPLQSVDERKTIMEICEREGIDCKFAGKAVDYYNCRSFVENYSKVVKVDSKKPFYESFAFWPMINTPELLNSATFVNENGGKVVFTGHGGDEGVSHRTNTYEMWNNREYGNYFDFYYYLLAGKRMRRLRAVKWGLSSLFRMKGKVRNDINGVLKTNTKEGFWQIISRSFLEDNRDIENIPLNFWINPRDFILKGGSRVRLDNVAMYGAFCNVRYMFPYLDYRLIDYAVSIERYMYLKNNDSRYILKQAFKDVLPNALLGEIDKSDPSFGGVRVEPFSYEEDTKRMRKSMEECKNMYDLSLLDGIFSLEDILREMDEKEITVHNHTELSRKCVKFFYAVKAVNAVAKSRDK